MAHHKMWHYLFQWSLPFTGCTWTRATIWTELACILVICLLSMHQRNCTATGRIFTGKHHITRHFFHSQITNVTCALSDYLWLFTILEISIFVNFDKRKSCIPSGPLHVGQQESFGRQFVQTRCPLWHCKIGGST